MKPPRYRSVAVYWPRLIAGTVMMTGVLILAAESRAAEPVLDSGPLTMLAIGVMFALVVGFGRPWADYELADDGILKREGLVFSLFRRRHWLPWDAVTESVVTEEMDGSRSLTLRTRHGAEWKVWEKFGSRGGFDAFRQAVAERLERRPREPGAPAPVEQSRSAWDRPGTRVLAGALALGWVVLLVLTLAGPAAGRGNRLGTLVGTELLLAPLLYRAYRAPSGSSKRSLTRSQRS